ncbi:hypothetical protein WR25_04124 [Diploscapter pachys]|uniref:Bestrophin homolog n=1 Tax=Diploscapter pachys TaxID=2018661 RepID=A0A2A2KTH0_9BILA|nr:hypothetical protein WR25_04124 [Diploscapter pachys]
MVNLLASSHEENFFSFTVVSRWWQQFQNLNWPEDLLAVLCTFLHANDEKSQKRRHAIARYLNLSAILALRDVSSKVRLRFPHISTFVTTGLLTEKEFDKLQKIENECENIRWMTPLHWVQQIVRKEEEENKPTAGLMGAFLTELKTFRQNLRRLYVYDWINVPLDESEEDDFWKNRGSQLPVLPHTLQSRKLREHAPKLHSYVPIGAQETKEMGNVQSKCCSIEQRKR